MKHLGTISLKTSRLLLRPFASTDTDAMYKGWANDPTVTQYMLMESGKTWDGCLNYMEGLVRKYSEDLAFYRWAIDLNGEAIGSIGLFVDDSNQSASFAYLLAQKAWGQGFATEAVNEVLRFAFEELDVNRVHADHFAENPASGRVMEKAGMLREGIARQKYYAKEKYHDAVLYGILREEHMQK